jgi:lipopolysaccharide/colanic/teichoic acid biosynthesis glycosyltransferase
MKRAFDIVVSSIGLILLLPFFVVLAVLIRIDDPGPVFFRQKRIGKDFKPFFIYKFRTMVKNAEQKGSKLTTGGDQRITRVGMILRTLKIDELPQLLNVLKGEMSLVGVRPEVEEYVELYKKEYTEILQTRPGITDICSITFRNEEELLGRQSDPEWYYAHVLLPQKIGLGREYVSNASFLYDIKLIFKTFYAILFPPALFRDIP